MTKPRVRPDDRGLGDPDLYDDGMVILPITCASCGSDLVPLVRAHGTRRIVRRLVLACTSTTCGAQWMFTYNLRPLKDHEVQRFLELAEQHGPIAV